MTLALVFDTETTGIPLYGADNPADAEDQPRLCSISMALIEEDTGDVTERLDAFIKPIGWPLDNEVFRVAMHEAIKTHGLTIPILMESGVPIETVHADWKRMYAEADYLCAFNISFDHKVIRGEWARLGEPIPFRDKKWFCLMHAAARALGKNKRVRADVACEKLLGHARIDAHSSKGDLNFNLDLFRYFQERGLIVLEDHPEARQHAEAPTS